MTQINTEEIECANCHITYWITKQHQNRLYKEKTSFYCPSGHKQNYGGKTDAQKLEEEIYKKESYQKYYETSEKENDSLRKQLAKQKKLLKTNKANKPKREKVKK